MKNTIYLIFLLLLPLLAPAQSTQEITDILQEIVEENGVYYVVTTTKFSAGPPRVEPERIGDRAAMLTYAQTAAVNRQLEISAAQRKVIEEKTLGFRQFLGLDTLVRNITGGDTTLFNLNNFAYHPDLAGRYRLRNQAGTTNFTATLVLYANGAVRFQREDDPAVTYPVLIYSPVNFAVLALPLGTLPAARYDLVEVAPTATGLRVWRDELRLLTITKLE